MLSAISYTAARNNFAQTMDRVCEDHAPIIITRQNAAPVVMISLNDYEAMAETAYLLRSPKNASRLAEAIEQIETGKCKKRELPEDGD